MEPPGQYRILVVDPHPTLRMVLAQRLRQDGHMAAAVGSATEALEVCIQEQPELLVSAELLEETTALKLAIQIAGYSLPALMAIKESVNRAHESALSEGILFERRELHARFASEDAHEGMHAFLDKRKPVFQHR